MHATAQSRSPQIRTRPLPGEPPPFCPFCLPLWRAVKQESHGRVGQHVRAKKIVKVERSVGIFISLLKMPLKSQLKRMLEYFGWLEMVPILYSYEINEVFYS